MASARCLVMTSAKKRKHVERSEMKTLIEYVLISCQLKPAVYAEVCVDPMCNVIGSMYPSKLEKKPNCVKMPVVPAAALTYSHVKTFPVSSKTKNILLVTNRVS